MVLVYLDQLSLIKSVDIYMASLAFLELSTNVIVFNPFYQITDIGNKKGVISLVFTLPLLLYNIIYCNTRNCHLKGLAHAKIIKKSVILFRVLNRTI